MLIEARKGAHYARLGKISFDERSYRLNHLTVENVWCFGKIDINFDDQLVTSGVGRANSGNLRRKEVVK